MADQTTAPTVTMTRLDNGRRHIQCESTVLIGGRWTQITAGIVMRADVDLQPHLTTTDGVVHLDLVNSAGDVVTRTVQWLQPTPAEPEPWPRTLTVPPGVWTELPGGAGTVLNEADATAMVTVGEDGEVTFSSPMRWRPAEAQEADYDGWGEDV